MRVPTICSVLLAAIACLPPTDAGLVQRLSIESIAAPDSVAAPGPLTIDLVLNHGACHDNIRISAVQTPGVITLEARADYRLPAGTGACIDIALEKDTTLTIASVGAGALVIRGGPLDVPVTVTPD